jgi:hypothetical protein
MTITDTAHLIITNIHKQTPPQRAMFGIHKNDINYPVSFCVFPCEAEISRNRCYILGTRFFDSGLPAPLRMTAKLRACFDFSTAAGFSGLLSLFSPCEGGIAVPMESEQGEKPDKKNKK